MYNRTTTRVFASCRPDTVRRTGVAGLAALISLTWMAATAGATTLADQPVFASSDVPGNLALVLSVEYPTANSVANLGNYSDAATYLGYFDPAKCYTYTYVYSATTSDGSGSYFQPASAATGTNSHSCSGQWSGNFMNWAAMQTIDPFRWALSGGYRNQDTTTVTILEKAWADGQGGVSNYPDRGVDQSTAAPGNNLAAALVATVTPFTGWTDFNLRIEGNGNRMVFSSTGTAYQSGGGQNDLTSVTTTAADPSHAYQVYVRVKVCDAGTTLGTTGLEANCVKYGSNYKPEGLLQQYSNKIRFSAFAYLNGDGQTRQGGVLREPMGFIGPTYPQPLSSTVVTNSRPEWDATTGVMAMNPDTATATASGVTQSGVLNYLNKFGETYRTNGSDYMLRDNVSELYYAAVRYFENLGNVAAWTSSATAAQLDGFPAVTTWSDPIAYSCQKNFILGIGDDHTHVDYNVGGGTYVGSRAKPSAVSSDTLNQTETWMRNLQTLEGITPTDIWALGAGEATYYIAGLAYGTHVNDIRSDLPGSQTISTYWMDVMEYQRAENLNPYYLAAKYGGFSVPTAYSTSNTTTPLTLGWWDTTGNTINMNGTTQNRPDNYFLAGNANQMVTGLKSAFTNIANAVKAYTTSFSLSTATVSASGAASYAAQYDSNGWTGVVTASDLTFAANGTPSATLAWVTSTTLQTQLAGTGWNTGRQVVTWSGTAGVPFRVANLSTSQLTALTPSSYSSATTSTQYLNYLRGDQTNEVGSSVTGSTKSLRARTLLLGDIVDAKLTPVTAPGQIFSAATNPGYAAFKTTWASRPTMVYAGANDGMLHAFNGALSGTGAGAEQFAYIPGALFQGPNGTPQVDGLAEIGNPSYVHHYYVDATPLAFDVDFNYAGGTFTTVSAGTSDWHTLLIGGLGKGGKSFYAIDVTDPASMSTESAAAGKVLWEFTDSTMGYSFGAPVVAKTAKYGWVVALTSGYNNSDGYGYLYLVNPKTGALLEKIATPSASPGLAQATSYIQDYTNYTADSIYVGDLSGQIWRFDLTLPKGSTSAYPAPTLLATLTDASGNAQPVTTAPLIEIHPTTRKRFVLVGTGRLLSSADITSSAAQSFYAIIDGTSTMFNSISTPIARSDLQAVTDVTAGITLSANSKGWYTDLGISSNIGWRVVLNPVAYNGIVAFTDLLTSGDACSPSGSSRVYVLNYATGTSVLNPATTGSTTPAPYVSFTTAVTDLKIVGINGSSGVVPEVLADTSAGGAPTPVPANLTGVIATRLLNWREIPTAD